MIPLEARRFLFVTGKGGVGKTTTAAALACAFAKRGRRVLVASSDDNERLSSLFGASPLTGEIRTIAENVFGVRLIPEEAMREYGSMMLRSRTVFSAVFNRGAVRRFFAGVPGLSEWAVLGKAWFHSSEITAEGRPRFDLVIFDAPATGHALDMLRVPQVILDVAPPGILRRDAERALGSFRDPGHTGVVVVALAEELPATETLELVAALRNELRVPVARLVVNAVVEPLFSPEERERLAAFVDFDAKEASEEVLVVAAHRAVRERVQADAMQRLSRLAVPVSVLPFLPETAGAHAAVECLAARLEQIPAAVLTDAP